MTPIEIVDAFIAAIEAKDIDAAVALTADDVSYENMPIDPVVGHDELATTLHGYLDTAGEVDWRIVEQWAVDRTVINERVDRFQIGDGWLELPVAGIFKIDDDGKIALWRDYFDLASYMRQLTELTGT
jgi:limonene-1,2-epoxide hydrolase